MSNPLGPESPVYDPFRLELIGKAGLLDQASRPAFDRFARLVARLLDVPIGAVTVVHPDGQTLIGGAGLSGDMARTRRTELSHSYCRHVVESGVPLVFGDARHHPLVRDNPAIADDAIAYAGVPIFAEGEVVGTLCAIDSQPRVWSGADLTVLRDLVGVLNAEVELRLLKNAISGRTDVLHSNVVDTHFSAVFEHSTAGMFILSPEGDVLRCNPAMEHLLQRSASELRGRSVGEFVHPDDRPQALARFEDLIAGKTPSFRAEERCLLPSGGFLWGRVTATAVRSTGGLPICVIMMKDDLSSQKLAASELLEREEQVIQAQKMDALGRLASGIAHDFNNVLTVITAYSGIALSECPPGSEMHDNLTEVETAARQAAGLTRQLLAFSRKVPPQPAVIDINPIVADLTGMLSRIIAASISIRSDLAPDLWPAYADRTQIEQVLMNLAVNARDAMPDGGTITITTRNVTVDSGRAGPDEIPAGSYVVISVSDTGTGIPDNVRARIFDPFFTTKGEGKGTGLGLATVKQITERAGGRIELETVPGKGTEFTLYFPRSAGRAA